MSPDVSAVLVNYNTAALLPACLSRLHAASAPLKVQVIVVDNASSDGSVEVLRRECGDCQIVENRVNVGFGRANNQVLARAVGRYVLLLNTDAFVEPDALQRTVEYMDAHPRCGVLGVRLVGRDRDLQPSCRYFPTPWNVFLTRTGLGRWFPRTTLVDDAKWDPSRLQACDWVPGCFYLVRQEVVQTVGLFDPRFFLYYEEVDHCRRVKQAGWEVTYFPDTTVVHIGGESAKSLGASGAGRQVPALQIESELLYFRKHHGLAGVAAALALATLGGALLMLKALLRPDRRTTLARLGRHAAATWRAFIATGAGRFATR